MQYKTLIFMSLYMQIYMKYYFKCYIGGVPLSGGSNCHNQNGWCRTKHDSDNQAPTKLAWTKNLKSNRIADIVSHSRSITGVKSSQCQMVRVEVSHCLTGAWINNHSTYTLMDMVPFSHCIEIHNHGYGNIFQLYRDTHSYTYMVPFSHCIEIRPHGYGTIFQLY